MKEDIKVSKNNIDNKVQEKLALSYLSKYINELQIHFNLSDESLKHVMQKATSSIKHQNSMNKFLDMLKSFW